MSTATETTFRDQLLDRRRRLQTSISEAGEATDLVRLLQEVDAALKRMDERTYGVCDVCHEAVDEPYGVERLCHVLEAGRGLSPGALAAACFDDLRSFQAGAPRTDDLTLLILRRTR